MMFLICVSFFSSFLVFQEVFWRENWAVFCLAGVVYIVPHPIFCHWGDRVSLWVCDNWGRYSQVSPFRGKALFPYSHSLDFRPTCEYISHTSFQSPRSLSHIPPHTCNFPPKSDLGAAGLGNGCRAMLVLTVLFNSSSICSLGSSPSMASKYHLVKGIMPDKWFCPLTSQHLPDGFP